MEEKPSQEKLPTKNIPESTKSPQQSSEEESAPLSRIRTYQDIVKEALRTQSMSGAKMLMSEQKRREEKRRNEENNSIKTPRNKLLLGISIGLIVIAAITLSAVFLMRDTEIATGPRNVIDTTFFDADSVVEVAAAQVNRNTILKIQQVLTSPVPQNTVQQIIITKETGETITENDIDTYQTRDILALIEARIPENFKEALDTPFFLGTHALISNEPFLLFKINDFETIFAGMFQWENTLVKDMTPLFSRNLSILQQTQIPPVPQTLEVSATSSTSTQSIAATSTPTLPVRTINNTRDFRDRVIANTDARIIQDENGRMLFFYTFIDEQYLFFGTNIATYYEVVKRIRSARLVL